MIIRKPYAFLIKNFKKIHIALLILGLFVGYKLFDVTSFVNEFMKSVVGHRKWELSLFYRVASETYAQLLENLAVNFAQHHSRVYLTTVEFRKLFKRKAAVFVFVA